MFGKFWDFALFLVCFIFAFWFLIYLFCGQETYFIWFIPFKFTKTCFVAQDRVCLLNISWTLKKNLYSAVVWGVIATYIKLVDNIVQVFYQFSPVTQSCPTLWPHKLQHARPPVHHQLPEFTPTHVHWVGDAIQPSHSLSSPSPPAFNLSQHQGLLKWVSSSHQVARILEFQL